MRFKGFLMKNKLEKLAELEHQQWMEWAKSLVSELENLDKEKIEKRLKRWKEECFKPYSELTDEMKEFDREWARKVLEIVE
jgi:hypothetical protein